MSSEALQALADVVGDYIDRDMAVGAELLVIKNGHTVLHEAFASRDREAGIPMERNTLFNIRSMTKPILCDEEDGQVVAFSVRGPGGDSTFTRMSPPVPDPDG